MNTDTIPASTNGQPQDLQLRHHAAEAPASVFHAGPINILIVDDDPKNLSVLETVLDNPGYRLVRAESADQALLALVDEEFALLILDIRMPDMTGLELAHMIKKRKKTAQVPIIFLTAYYNEDQHMIEGYETGAVDYLLKPVNPAILRSKVAVFAELHRNTRAMFAEMTERRRAEAQLRQLNETLEQRVSERTEALALSETRYRDLIYGLPAALYTCDEQGRIRLYNQAAAALWGREPEVGVDPWCGSWKIYRPDGTLLPLDECPMAVSLREGRAVRGEEIVIERPDGTRRSVIPHPEPMLNAAGEVVGAVNMLVDITDLKQVEQAVAHLAAIVTSSDDAIIAMDLHGIVTSWNHAAEHLYGYTAHEMIGQPVSRFIPPERHDEESKILDKIMLHERVEHFETVRRRKDGTDVTVSLTVSPVVDPQGRIIGVSKIARNITEQKRIEDELRRSERDLSDFFDNASIGLHWVGPDGIIIRVNQTELDLLGYSRDEYIGHHIAEFHVDQPVIRDILDRLVCGETLREYPATIRCKDGSVREVLINSNALFDDGKFVHTRCFTRDVTERNRAEEALRENEERFRTMADNISQFAWTADPTGWIYWYNLRWYEYTGTTFDEMQGWGWQKVHHPDHLDRVVKKWRQALIAGEPWEDTFPLRGLDGTYRWYLSRALPIRDAEGEVIRWFGTNTDVTEQRETEAALRQSEERYRATFANAAVGIAHVALDGRWLWVNDAVCHITGYAREELQMKPFADITHPDDLEPEWANARRLLAGETATYSMEKRYIRKEGGLTWINLTVSLQRDEAGSPQNFICIIEDITVRKQAETALRASEEQLMKQASALTESNKELEGFSYSVSHDLRAPLRTIDAFSRIVEEELGPALDGEARRCLNIVRKSASEAGHLIDDLLNFSKLGRQGIKFQSVKMADLAREAADNLLRIMPEGRKIDLTIGNLPPCQGDRRLITLVWTNLLSNAFKYTKYREAGRIEVDWLPDDASPEAVTYFVKDNGIGFDMEYVHKLFGVFQRLHHKEEFDGTGVGLAIVQRIIQRHGGRVWAEGKVNSGATFYFSLRKGMGC